MTVIRVRAPDGRAWTPREWFQGKPLGHPTHALLVHYPVALAAAVTALDLIARVARPQPGLVRAAAFLAIGASATGALAWVTGLVDWLGMVRGSRKRRVATTHLVVQSLTVTLLVASAIIRWPDRAGSVPSWGALVVAAAANATVLVGNYFGGELVYRMGMRVSTGGSAE